MIAQFPAPVGRRFCRDCLEAVDVGVFIGETDTTRPIAIAPNRLCVLEDDLENVARAIGTIYQHAKAAGSRMRLILQM